MPNISEEKWIEMLEKKADGTYIAKYPKVKSKTGVTFDEHLAEKATDTQLGHVKAKTKADGTLMLLLSPETAALYGLTGDDATVDDVLKFGTKWKLIQSYTQAGTYEWTAPDLNNGNPYKVGVYIIGGGGSGAALKRASTSTNYWITASGGASGYAIAIIKEVIPGNVYPIVVGAGGLPASTTTSNSSAAGNSGGSSSFDGYTVNGGGGGDRNAGETSGSSQAAGANGGQGSDAQPSSRIAPAFGSQAYSTSARSGGLSRYSTALNPFDGLFRLSAGGGCNGNAAVPSVNIQEVVTMPDGLTASPGVGVIVTDTHATAEKPTSPGCGGGAAMIALNSSTTGSGIATSAAGADGAVFIYV